MRKYLLAAALGVAAVLGRAAGIVEHYGQRIHARLKFLAGDDAAHVAKHGQKLNGARARRCKYKARLHARKRSRKRGSGRTAARIKQKAKRHG